MNRNVKITIHTIQTRDGQKNEIKLTQEGQYFKKGEHHYVLYDEAVEDSSEIIKNRMKFSDNFMEVTKKGALSSEMHFETGQNYPAEYRTPFGTMQLAMSTSNYYLNCTDEHHITIGVNYDLEADGSLIANCRMQIQIEG